MRAFGFADLVNGQDVWMIESGGRLRLPLKAEQAIRILCDGGGQQFERDLTFKPDVLGQIDFAHSSLAKQADDLVGPDTAPDRRLIIFIIRQPLWPREDWRVNETALPLVCGDQSHGLLAQLLVVAAHFRQMDCPGFSLKLQDLVEQSVQFFPLFRRHRHSLLISLRSQALAMLQSRLTVAGEIRSASAVCSIVSPVK